LVQYVALNVDYATRRILSSEILFSLDSATFRVLPNRLRKMLIQTNVVLQAMIEKQWLFPATECVHIVSFALSVGTITLVDFSLLGIGLQRKAASQLVRSTDLWTLSGFVLIVFSGLLLFASDPDHYYLSSVFQFKIACLVLAVIFNYTIHRKVALSADASGMASKMAAGVSLVLWVAVIFGGLFFSFA